MGAGDLNSNLRAGIATLGHYVTILALGRLDLKYFFLQSFISPPLMKENFWQLKSCPTLQSYTIFPLKEKHSFKEESYDLKRKLLNSWLLFKEIYFVSRNIHSVLINVNSMLILHIQFYSLGQDRDSSNREVQNILIFHLEVCLKMVVSIPDLKNQKYKMYKFLILNQSWCSWEVESEGLGIQRKFKVMLEPQKNPFNKF